MGSSRLTALAVVAVLAGCEPGRPGAAPSARPSRTSPYVYVCGGSVFDPVLLDGPALEQGDPRMQDLVESLERSSPEAGGWRVVSDDGERVGLMARREGRGYAYASFERSGDGWTPDEFGECTPDVVVGRRAPVTWELDVEPAPGDTELTVMATERSCQGDRKLTQRNTRFDVEYGDDAITIVGTTRPEVGGNCIGRPWRLKVRLDEPLGDRALFDAAVYPPERRYP